MPRAFVIAILLGLTTSLWGQSSSDESDTEEKEFVWSPTKVKEFTTTEINKECQAYNKKFIGYYGRIFWVEDCKLHELVGQDLTNRLFQKPGIKITAVHGETVAMIPTGKPLNNLPDEHVKSLSCQELDNQYVILEDNEIYYVGQCRKYLLPDYETYVQHAKDGNRPQVIRELTAKEFYAIKSGPDIPSIMPAIARRLMDREEEVDVIPISEACAGIEGKYVSYYSHVYLIEKCRKRPVEDLKTFMAKTIASQTKQLYELSSNQWVSLPDGSPVLLDKELER